MDTVSKVYSAELDGVAARLVEVEVDINVGLHAFNIVGLADKALSEARERVNSALKNSGLKPPNQENRKITVNLAPADVKKTGSQYDLAIAVGYLLAGGQLRPAGDSRDLFIGELALSGALRPVFGALSIVEHARARGFSRLFLPAGNASEAALVSGVTLVPVTDITQVIKILEGRLPLPSPPLPPAATSSLSAVNLSDVRGHAHAKRALSIAAAGGHNLLMVGPPGSGKSLLAQALISILPPLSSAETVEVTKIYGVVGLNRGQIIPSRPFRSPHHSASAVSIIGGGASPRPGEISLAHRGVLFLDELPEFHRDVLESLRQPLENGAVTVSRARGVLEFPARFTLVAAMNPCPCGFWGDPERACRCGAYDIIRYQKKLSGPLLDRIDLNITVPRLSADELLSPPSSASAEETSRLLRQVLAARVRQQERFSSFTRPIFTNSELTSRECDELIKLDEPGESFVKKALSRSLLSPRGYYRLLKVARTIADLENSPSVAAPHLQEAFSYRLKDNE